MVQEDQGEAALFRVVRRVARGPDAVPGTAGRSVRRPDGVQLKAMIYLGVDCGFGNEDCGTLPMDRLDLQRGWHTGSSSYIVRGGQAIRGFPCAHAFGLRLNENEDVSVRMAQSMTRSPALARTPFLGWRPPGMPEGRRVGEFAERRGRPVVDDPPRGYNGTG
jgi:hypothetical protein